MSVLRTIVDSSRAIVTGAKDIARLREIGAIFLRHGFGWAIRALKIRRELALETDDSVPLSTALAVPDTGKRLVAALTELGPTWVKFGQILSTRPELLPAPIVRELASLQDAVEPVPFSEIEAQLARNLGARWRDQVAILDETPLASASIGQVHTATLVTGERVVFKVQRPGIRPKITADLHILSVVAGYLEEAFEEAKTMDLVGMTEDFRKSLEQELDYRAEAANMDRFRANFANNPRVMLPALFPRLSGSEVLCMEFVEGRKLTDVFAAGEDVSSIVQVYFDMSYTMLFVDGFFHGDLHPGNVFVTADDRLALIDCGMVGRLSPSRKDKVIDILWAIVNQDFEGVARVLFELAVQSGPVDYPAFEAHAIGITERYIAGVPLSQINIGELFGELVKGATRFGMRMPSDFTMMFKAMMTTEGMAKTIAPDIDPLEMARPYLTQMVAERYSLERLQQQAIRDATVLSGLLRTLPRMLPQLVDSLQRGDIALGVSEKTLDRQERMLERRTATLVKSAFVLVLVVCGTASLAIPGLSIGAIGLPWPTLVFWSLAVLGTLRLLHRGALL